MQDLRGNRQLFDGALILLSGDFRQILPVIPRSTPADEINAYLKSSFFWRYVRKLTVNINMRIHLHNDATAHEFSKQLLEIGDGKIQIDSTNGLITVPNNFDTIAQSIDELIECVFPNILQNYRNHDWLRERAILAPKNIHINGINFQMQAKLPGVVTTYKSIDSVMNQDEAMNYPFEFLNSLEPAGIPPHCLNLKVGSLIILLRNINPPKLCNGTRLAVKKLLPNLIEATILTGKSKGEVCLIPRIPMIPTDMPFEFKRLQYPVRLSFAMSINKAQGQTLHAGPRPALAVTDGGGRRLSPSSRTSPSWKTAFASPTEPREIDAAAHFHYFAEGRDAAENYFLLWPRPSRSAGLMSTKNKYLQGRNTPNGSPPARGRAGHYSPARPVLILQSSGGRRRQRTHLEQALISRADRDVPMYRQIAFIRSTPVTTRAPPRDEVPRVKVVETRYRSGARKLNFIEGVCLTRTSPIARGMRDSEMGQGPVAMATAGAVCGARSNAR
ncbi:hypothetical protein EVAR_25301_1 [Eumeta japonica]|uniref:ATP-dependent DNA helicase n=1 Tax=Eumeta variegata TaxID=151549 RepID=A0A4C1VQH9_EUMVA|nr:hypothetical protein EVAR_25301_1 [Eumeta japonica]